MLSLLGINPLVGLIKQYLHNYPAQRPRTGDLVAKLCEIQTPGMWLSKPSGFCIILHHMYVSALFPT